MTTRTELLKLLRSSRGEFLSGQKIGETLGVSRNSVWKAVAQLKKEGYPIEGKSNAGYRLTAASDPLTPGDVESVLRVPCGIQVHDVVTSTNDIARSMPLSHRPAAIIANQQSAGRGRLGRSFESPGGTGLYMTIALKPAFALNKALFVTMACAVAACRAIERVCGVSPSIKWVNDIFLEQKKICGILTEAQSNLETGEIDSLIIGTGINCFPSSFSPEISHIAGCISDTPGAFSRGELAGELINQTADVLEDIESRSFFFLFLARCFILGQRILVHAHYDSRSTLALARDIDEDGGLIVEYLEGPRAGILETLHTGEISIVPVQ